jgi:WD40 repeat protein
MTRMFVAALALAVVGCSGSDAPAPPKEDPAPPVAQALADMRVPHAISALFSPDNKRLLIRSEYYPDRGRRRPTHDFRPLRLWDLEKSQEVNYGGPQIYHGCAVFVGDRKHILSANADAGRKIALNLWETDTGKITRVFPDNEFIDIRHDGVTALGISPNGKIAVTGHWHGQFKVWNVEDGKVIKTMGQMFLPASSKTIPNGLFFRADGKSLVSSSQDELKLWDVATGKEKKTWNVSFNYPRVTLAESKALVFSTHGFGEHLLLWEFPSGKQIRNLNPTGSLLGAMLTPDGKSILYGCKNGLLVREDVVTGKKIWSTQAPKGNMGLSAVAFSHDGKLGFTGNQDGTMILWDALTGKRLRFVAEDQP